MTNKQEHMAVCQKLNSIYEAKNQDYGNSFREMFQKLGIITAVTRIGDKFSRLANLSVKPNKERKVLDESIKDTVYDLANYAIMTIMEIEKNDNSG